MQKVGLRGKKWDQSPFSDVVQSNLSYPGALGLGGARNSDLSVSQNTI